MRLDVMSWVINGMKPVTEAKDEILTLRIKNHIEKLTAAQRQARYQAKKKAHALCQLFAGKQTA